MAPLVTTHKDTNKYTYGSRGGLRRKDGRRGRGKCSSPTSIFELSSAKVPGSRGKEGKEIKKGKGKEKGGKGKGGWGYHTNGHAGYYLITELSSFFDSDFKNNYMSETLETVWLIVNLYQRRPTLCQRQVAPESVYTPGGSSFSTFNQIISSESKHTQNYTHVA